MPLGKYPDVSLAPARDRRREASRLFAVGVDPMAQRKAVKTADKAAVEHFFRALPRNAASAAYQHALYLKPRAKMMQDWADFLKRTQRRGEVIQMPDRTASCKPPLL